MIDLLKKTLLTGVGVAALSKEKIETLVKELVEKGKVSEQEGRSLIDQLLASSEEARQELQKQIEAKVQLVLEKMDLAKKSDLDALQKQVDALKKELQK